jgi:hypothetical protein
MKYYPAIVVVAYNRPHSLKRLLSSLANIRKAEGARLIISIDNNGAENQSVVDIARNYEWPFGEKEVIHQPVKLGLRKHILQCGDLSKKFGSVIVLEDDLFVSPYFYDYAVQALAYYEADEKAGGISLYNHVDEDMTELPFMPIQDDSDVYFIQFPSSWGQAWSESQWTKFRTWYDKQPDISKIRISPQVLSWRESSWKKYFNAYLVDSDKYFVFPRVSLTTNFNDKGTHKVLDVNHNGQSPLRINDTAYRFKYCSDSYCRYDAHFELKEETIHHFRPELAEYSFELDLYGIKMLDQVKVPYLITIRPTRNFISGYQRTLKPHEMNVILNLPGDEIRLCRKEDVITDGMSYRRKFADYKYYYDNHLSGFRLSIYERMMKSKLLSLFLHEK